MKKLHKAIVIIPLLLAIIVSALWATDALTIGPTGEVTINGNLTVNGVVHDAYGRVMPIGSIIAFAKAIPSSGWQLCDGSEQAGAITRTGAAILPYPGRGNGTSDDAIHFHDEVRTTNPQARSPMMNPLVLAPGSRRKYLFDYGPALGGVEGYVV